MKGNKLFIVMLLAFANVSAQSIEEPIKEMGRYFTFVVNTPEGTCETLNLWAQRRMITLDGKEYLPYNGYYEDGTIVDEMVLLRKDGMKYFCYDSNMSTEHLLFDYGLQKGSIHTDDYNNEVYEVTDIRDSIIGDESLRLIELVNQNGKHDIWLEGTGSIYTGIMRGATVSSREFYLIRVGSNRFYPNNQYVKTADISATKLIWEGKLETAEDRKAYEAWYGAPSNLNAEFVDDTLHVWGRLHTSYDILSYAICGLRENCVYFKLYSNGELDCYNNYEVDARISGFEKGTYKVNLNNKTLDLACMENNKTFVTFTKGQMATIILPIAPDASKGRYYRLDRCEKGQIIFEEEQQPQARTPYIIVPNDDFSINPSTLDLEGLTQDEVSIEGISFIGSYIGKVLPSLEGDGGGSYYDIIDKTPDCGLSSLGETGKGAFIGALRAYLQVPWDEPYNPGGTKSPQEKMEIVLKDNPNGIETIQNPMFKVQNDRGIFDLQGRKVTTDDSSVKKGIYIKDGKKVLLK